MPVTVFVRARLPSRLLSLPRTALVYEGLVHVESTRPLEPSITLAILARTEPCLTICFL
jgi:hypothetical protein